MTIYTIPPCLRFGQKPVGALWARALAVSGGDQNKAISTCINLRVTQRAEKATPVSKEDFTPMPCPYGNKAARFFLSPLIPQTAKGHQKGVAPLDTDC
jgi:hypothetical protein